jgi:outer membrane protein assembly factor BamB
MSFGFSCLLFFLTVMPVRAQTSADWSTVAHDPQRTSWTPEQVTGDVYAGTLKPIWYRPIEAYIPQNSQVIAADNMLYVATAKGLYALDPNTGNINWRFDTEMPLGDSPTVVNKVVYIGSMDRRLLAINADTGGKLWSFDNAKAGYSTNPLVLTNTGKTVIYIGNRDGNFYAIQDNGTSPQLLWSFATAGPINMSAAASKDNSTIYFGSNDNYAYALNALNGTQVWKSTKFPGAGFDSYWPVVYHESTSNKDYVIFTQAYAYRQAQPPSTQSVVINPTTGQVANTYNEIESSDLKNNFGWTTTLPITTALAGDSWAKGKTIVDSSCPLQTQSGCFLGYYETKPYRRTVVVLNANDGREYTFDSNGNGKPEYAPFPFVGTRSGNRFPPVVGPDGATSTSTSLYFFSYWDPTSGMGSLYSWKFGTQFLSVHPSGQAVDEPPGFSMGGNVIYRNNCCDRDAQWVNVVDGSTGILWTYSKALYGGLVPGYDDMWYNTGGGLDRLDAYYGGSSQYVYNRSGVYHNHGDGHSIIPYQGKLFSHQSNAIIAFGTTNGTVQNPADKGDLRIIPVNDSTIPVPSSSDLVGHLENEVKKMITAGDLKIGYYNNGQAELEEMANYFENPGETMYTMTMAYPYLSSATQSQLLNYIKQEFADYFNPTMYSSRGWDNTVGVSGRPRAAREAYNLPPEVQADANTKPKTYPNRNQAILHGSGNYGSDSYRYEFIYPQFNFYALWKYAQLVPQDALTAYNLAKGVVDIPLTSGSVGDSEFTYLPWQLNNYISGYIGFLNLQKLVGKDTTDSTLRTQVQNELTRLETLRATNLGIFLDCATYPPYVGNGAESHCREFYIGKEFYYLTPELGNYLNQNALSAAQNKVTELAYVAPYWLEEGFNSVHEEGVKENLYDVSILLAKAYILKQPYSEIAKYIDTPTFAVGDLLYMNNLIAALSASGQPTPGPVTPTPTPVGDLNGDGKVDGADLLILLQNYLTNNTQADLNHDGIVNMIDGGILIGNIGK